MTVLALRKMQSPQIPGSCQAIHFAVSMNEQLLQCYGRLLAMAATLKTAFQQHQPSLCTSADTAARHVVVQGQ